MINPENLQSCRLNDLNMSFIKPG